MLTNQYDIGRFVDDFKRTFCENRDELKDKYFNGLKSYGELFGNMGIMALLSDLQEEVQRNFSDTNKREHYRQILNDIKCILSEDDYKRRQLVEEQNVKERG